MIEQRAILSSFLVFLLAFVLVSFKLQKADVAILGHNAGKNCMACHPYFKVAGTVFNDLTGTEVKPGISVSLTKQDGSEYILDNTNTNGNFFSTAIPNGKYLIRVKDVTSRTWHEIPGQGSCNLCHIVGGNGSEIRIKIFHTYHTQIPSDNDCRHCHHYPASQSYSQLKTPGVLNSSASTPQLPGSRVEIMGKVFPFNPSEYSITTTRPDIFAPGYFSMFDVILAVAKKNGININYDFDRMRGTHFITEINGKEGDYWYHFSYDAGSQNASEINFRRANRWDEALWRPGVWIKVVEGENLNEIRKEYIEEMVRVQRQGNIIPSVRISINPSNYKGNPPESDRITVSREFSNVKVFAHDLRAAGSPSPYPKPFQPGVVTSLDILLSLMDQGALNLVTSTFYTNFAGHYIQSFYVVALGFPGIGVAHASGRQGFVYVTENGSFNSLPNNADNKLHMTSDINIIHAPDFSYWRWVELGNPYYERNEPGNAEMLAASVIEDYNSLSRGFNLYLPRQKEKDGSINISFNLFEPGQVDIALYDKAGQKIQALYSGRVKNIGIHKLNWTPQGDKISPGLYSLVMKCGDRIQIRNIPLSLKSN